MLLDRIEAIGLVPVIKIEDADRAVGLGEALLIGNLPVAEVTLRTVAAFQAIETLAKRYPQILVGAGTILDVEQAKRAIDSGATFAVTPGFSPKVVDYLLARGFPVVAGVNNPSQVEMGLDRGLSVLKFFPAEASGGVAMLKSLGGPYPEVRFMPTGGIESANLEKYLSLPNVLACGGSWMVKDTLIRDGRFDEIRDEALQAARQVAEIRSRRGLTVNA